METLYCHSFDTRWGLFRTAASEKGLVLVDIPGNNRNWFEKTMGKYFSDYKIDHGGEVNQNAKRQIVAFLDGNLTKFNLPLDIRATPFQLKVLKHVTEIPYGRTMTYGEVARAIDHPRAFRAVGTAVGANKLPLVIPCHRVVSATGLGGFSGGLAMKKRLLKLEGTL